MKTRLVLHKNLLTSIHRSIPPYNDEESLQVLTAAAEYVQTVPPYPRNNLNFSFHYSALHLSSSDF